MGSLRAGASSAAANEAISRRDQMYCKGLTLPHRSMTMHAPTGAA
jgi:hypothetical protein